MQSSQVIAFCANIEETLDTVLFRKRDDDPNSVDNAKTVGGAAATVAAAGGGLAAKRAISNRRSGLRITDPGFAKKSGVRQVVEAASDLAGQRARVSGAIDAVKNGADKVRGAAMTATGKVRGVATQVADRAVATAGRAASGYRVARAGGLDALAVGARAAKKTVNPLLARLARLGAAIR